MENIKQNKILNWYNTIKNSEIINKINQFICSFWGTFVVACVTLLSFVFALEIVLYSLVCLYTIYICLFSKDFLPLVPLFVFCYIAPAPSNNPGRNEGSMFYGAGGVAIIVIAIICALAIFLRIGFDKNMSFKKLFTQRLYLTISMLILGGAYLISGIFCNIYSKIWLNNIVFALIQFLSIFLLYFILAATIDWKNADKDFLPHLAILMGIVVSLEVVYLYASDFRFNEWGEITKDFIITGWGISNNIAAMIALAIPFAFYLACEKQKSYLYLTLAAIFVIVIAMTLSRASFLTSLLIFAACWFICLFKAKNKKAFKITSLILIGLLVIFAAIFYRQIWDLFLEVLQIFEKDESGNFAFSDAHRFDTYNLGLQMFADFPIFGNSFFARGEWPWQYGTIDSFTSFFPARWHNTIIQLLASTGIVGLLAYIYHRVKTVLLVVKKPSIGKTFIGLSILSLLIMSMLDCHFFNVGPVLFYSIMLIFAEKLYSQEKPQELTTSQDEQNNTQTIENTIAEENITKPEKTNDSNAQNIKNKTQRKTTSSSNKSTQKANTKSNKPKQK